MKLPSNVTRISSGAPGPVLGIVVGVHGNELTGIKIIEKMLSSGIQIERGTLYIIKGNPKAMQKNVRFLVEDLNRCFLLDRHTGSSYEFRHNTHFSGIAVTKSPSLFSHPVRWSTQA